jgi:GTP-binding protein
MLIDEVIIKLEAGRGGDGLVSFRRERFISHGGPDGGDGGKGGDIFLLCDENVHALSQFLRVKEFHGENGARGEKRKRTGKSGKHLILKAPPGTIIFTEIQGKFIKFQDLVKRGERILIAKGGQGGWGNYHFATATRQTPRFAQKGRWGQKLILRLELKLLADVGLIGLPNVGKSLFLSQISHAKPKIADYPFTTLSPNLGTVCWKEIKLIVADIPGLIEGAHHGKGLGDQFLRHIERTKILIHILDGQKADLLSDWQKVRGELKLFSNKLLNKEEIIVINKIDLIDRDKISQMGKTFKGKEVFPISSLTKKGIDQLLDKIIQKLH